MATKTLDQHIEVTPGIAGGKPHIAGRRITVQNIVIWHELLSKRADEIASEYDLTLADVYAALAYYFDHRSEIDRDIKESKAFVEALRLKTPSKLKRKLREQKLHGAKDLLSSVEQLSLSELEQFVFRVIELRAKRRAPNLSKDQAQLLKKINQGLSPDIQKRYNELNAKRKAETLTPEEHQELLQLTDQIEKSDAERVKYLAELAQLRGISLTALMKELDIRPPAYE